MLGVARHKHDTPTLVKRAQPNPIFDIQRLLAHRHDCLLPAVFLPLLLWRRDGVRSEPGAFLGYDCAVLGEEDEDEGVELSEIRGVRFVFVWCGSFVVDGRKKVVCFEVCLELSRVAVVLSLIGHFPTKGTRDVV